jgi:dTDP-4-amino-4,6-dideoxygalactose transaminase
MIAGTRLDIDASMLTAALRHGDLPADRGSADHGSPNNGSSSTGLPTGGSHVLSCEKGLFRLPGGTDAYRAPRGRAAIGWVLEGLGVGPGDEVVLPAVICPSVTIPVRRLGARIVTFGLCERTFAPAIDDCRAALSSSTRVMIVPHLYGARAPMEAFRTLAAEKGLVLIEDKAHLPPGAGNQADTPQGGECALYSFNYGKPLSVGWGAALVLSSELEVRLGAPRWEAMTSERDRLLAAAVLIQQMLMDESRLRHPLLSYQYAQDHLGREGEQAVQAVLDAAMGARPSEELSSWVAQHLPDPRPPLAVRLPPEVKRAAKAVLPTRMLSRAAGRSRDAKERPQPVASGGQTLLPGGLCERLLAGQAAGLDAGHWGRRADLAGLYAESLDPEKWIFPAYAADPRWSCYPVSMPHMKHRERLVAKIAREIGVDVYPHVWPEALHQVRRVRSAVRPGPGSGRSAQLTAGLLNLPVHSQMSETKVRQLVGFLNAV